MKKLEYQVSFTTPAFLGNAEQQAQWRTPPFKTLLRQWWRVAYAAEHGFAVEAMRREEGLLFGHAWLDDDRDDKGRKIAARRSLVRIRLDRWEKGRLKSWNGLEQPRVFHPEVQRMNYKVGPHAYLGYGPLDGRGNTKLSDKINAVIQPGESAGLSLAVPEKHERLISRALWLMDRYGTLGGRSRNGWGSLVMTPVNGTPSPSGELRLRPWREAIELDWPHAIGQDERGALVWQTEAFTDWKRLMREIAIIKIGLRTQFLFTTENNTTTPEARHWLSHPVTKHNVGPWKQARLPNNLRFKVRTAPGDPEKLVGVIFHVPCRPPKEFHPEKDVIVRTWQSVHALLDELCKPAGSRAYASILDEGRRAKLEPQLDTVNLNRASE